MKKIEKLVRLKESTYIQLNLIKINKNHSNFNQTIEQLIKDYEIRLEKFIEYNKDEKTENYFNILTKKIEDLDLFIRKDKSTLRKWFGAMEVDYFIKIKNKLFDEEKKRFDEIKNNPANFHLLNDNNSKEEKYQNLLNDYNKIKNENYMMNEKLKEQENNKLNFKKEFYKHLRKENDKIIIKLTEQELKEFFKNEY